MKLLISILIATLTMTSQANTTPIQQNGNVHYGKPTHIAVQPKTVTRSVPVLVKSPRIPKFKVLRSNPHRYAKIVIDDVDYEVSDEGLISPYRRKDLTRIEHDDGISDRVRWRLFLARQLALLKYREVHG
jgi:hypothetical protein